MAATAVSAKLLENRGTVPTDRGEAGLGSSHWLGLKAQHTRTFASWAQSARLAAGADTVPVCQNEAVVGLVRLSTDKVRRSSWPVR